MPFYHHRVLAGGLAIATGLSMLAIGARVLAQDELTAAAPPETSTKISARKKRHAVPKTLAAAPDAAKAAAPALVDTATKDGSAAPVAKANETRPAFDFAAQLNHAGASTCGAQVNALAAATMGDVQRFNTMSSWSGAAGDKRAVTIAIAQRYADGNAVPFGASEIIAAPNQQGSCDGFSVQILPSPLSCAKIRESMTTQRSKQLADLAGIPIIQDGGGGRTMLVPTKADACVLIAMRTLYAK